LIFFQGMLFSDMKRFLLITLIYLITVSAFAQKVTVQVLKTPGTGLSEWQIIDNQNTTIFSGSGYNQIDTVTFSLEANKYYLLKISVTEVTSPGLSLYTLSLNSEPLIYIKSDIGTGEHSFPFFTGVKAVDTKITGGTTALIADFPWQVYYISGNFRCGGSIIDGNWILTAAHCTQDDSGTPIAVSSMFIRAGLNNPSNALEGKTYAVSEVIVNEGFDNQTLLNDIALLRLKDTINFTNAKPIKIITVADVADGATVPGVLSWVTGWGLTHVNPNVLPTSLQKVQLPLITNAQASTVWPTIPATDMMAGYLNGNKDACNGDSGGPLVVPVLGEYKLAGIVSWGSPNCNTYGAYTRVSDLEAWIRSKTGISDFKPPPPAGDSIICHGTESSQYSIQPQTGATSYEWQLFPATAGIISGNSANASVLWNISFIGSVSIAVRITVNNKLSDWSRLDANVVLNTKLLSQSNDTIICANQPVTLNVNVEGYNLNYNWIKNGQSVQSGKSPELVFAASTTDDSGDYECEITGSCGRVVSAIRKLTVYPLTKITYISPNVEVPFGGDLTLQVNSDGHDLIYQWQKDGTAIENSNTPQLVISGLNATNIGIYRTTVTGTCGVKTSDSIYVYVKKSNFKADPEVFLWPSVTTDEFNVALNNDAFYNIQMFNSMGKKVIDMTNCRYQTRISINNLAKGVYVVEVFNNNLRKSIKVIKI
jgi:secreted trypsin-like serine protease